MTMALPKQGIPGDELLENLRSMARRDIDWRGHRAFGLVYHHSDVHTDLIQSAHNLFMPTNGLNPMAFKSLQKMEHDVVRIGANLLHGDDEVVGTMTSGGTESILLAVLAYRQHARRHKTWIRHPEIVVPESAHAAFNKAGEYFNVKIVPTRLRRDFRADVDAMKRKTNRNTIALVGSAVSYPYGVIDPIQEIAALGQERGIPVHVDACLGGFILPFIEKLERVFQIAEVSPFDFRMPGVTSISADIHKYGYAAKGASVILYRGMHYLRQQFSVSTDWCGGVYASPTLAGTRPGGAIAAAWTSLHALGEQGFLDNTRALMETTKRFIRGIQAVPELTILGRPVGPVVAYGSNVRGFSCYAVADYLENRGWHVDRLQRPESLHMILNPGHVDVVEKYLDDLHAAVRYVAAHPDAALEGNAPTYGLIASAPFRRLVKHQVLALVEQMYSAKGGIPNLDAVRDPFDPSVSEEDNTVSSLPRIVLNAMKWKARLSRLLRNE